MGEKISQLLGLITHVSTDSDCRCKLAWKRNLRILQLYRWYNLIIIWICNKFYGPRLSLNPIIISIRGAKDVIIIISTPFYNYKAANRSHSNWLNLTFIVRLKTRLLLRLNCYYYLNVYRDALEWWAVIAIEVSKRVMRFTGMGKYHHHYTI